MRTLLIVSLLLISHALLAQRFGSSIKDLPRHPRVVNDFGSFLSSSESNRLEDELISYRKRTGNAIVIITLSTLPYSLEETALQYFNKWGIGDRKKNNGVLILVSRNPRGIRITTGAGIDDILTDNDCQRIIDETITPSFKMGSFYTGLKEGVNDIEAGLGGGTRPALHSGLHAESQSQPSSYGGGQSEPDTETQVDNRPAAAGAVQSQQLQSQPQPQAQAVPTYTRKPMTVGQAIVAILGFALMVWLRVKYVRSKRSDVSSGNNNNVADYLSATGWVFLIYLRIMWWTILITFGMIAFLFTLGRTGNPLRRLDKDAGGSFGGGRSNGGGASGSW